MDSVAVGFRIILIFINVHNTQIIQWILLYINIIEIIYESNNANGGDVQNEFLYHGKFTND